MSKFNKLFKTIMEDVQRDLPISYWANRSFNPINTYEKNWGIINDMTPEEMIEFDNAKIAHSKRMDYDNYGKNNQGMHRIAVFIDPEYPDCVCYKCNLCGFKYYTRNSKTITESINGSLIVVNQLADEFYNILESIPEKVAWLSFWNNDWYKDTDNMLKGIKTVSIKENIPEEDINKMLGLVTKIETFLSYKINKRPFDPEELHKAVNTEWYLYIDLFNKFKEYVKNKNIPVTENDICKDWGTTDVLHSDETIIFNKVKDLHEQMIRVNPELHHYNEHMVGTDYTQHDCSCGFAYGNDSIDN